MRAALRTPARRWAALAVVVAIAVTLVAVWPRSAAAPVAEREVSVPGAQAPWDPAPVTLDATLYLPATTPAPAVILAHGFGGSKTSVRAQAQQLARSGFVVLAYSARGFGNSTGQIALDSLDAEVPDARKVVDYLATLPEVVQDGSGDPRVGVTGGSYGGALSLMLAGTDPRVDTAVPVITWNNLEHALFPNYVVDPTQAEQTANTPADAGGSSDGVFKKYWAATMIASVVSGAGLGATGQVDTGPAGGGVGRQSDEQSGSTAAPASSAAPAAGAGATGGTDGAPADPGCGRLRLEICAAYAGAAGTGRITPELQTLLEKSSPSQVVGKIKAPTLLVQGEQDTLFPLDQADANARAIAANGTEVALDWYRGGHDGGSPDQVTEDRITGWLVTHLRGGTMPANAVTGNGFRYSVDGGLTGSGRARTRILLADSYPGLTASSTTPRHDIPLTGAAQIVLNPAGGIPAGISSLPGLGSQSSLLSTFLGSGFPGQTATFTSAAATELQVITGSSRVQVTVTALGSVTNGAGSAGGADTDSVLFASIGTRSSGGVSTLAGSAVAPLRLPPLKAGESATLTVDLPAAALQVSAGDQLFVRFATTDQAYATPTSAAAYRISAVDSASVPVAGGVRVSAGEVSTAALIGLIVLTLLGIGGLIAAGRVRRRPEETQHDAAGEHRAVGTAAGSAGPDASGTAEPVLPLEIRGLSKSYPGGVMAVKDVSFVVRPGRVVGLLGPNGAGKTTTLRMVMGLIQPTAGDILVFGRPVRSGAEILSRIGSFVEGSGFLPHLSGKVNLELYWGATGRPREDAHLDEILEIAGLGKAIHRRVKTYSQGMRQRLAIAQSMLGLPDLLILDEPTNGLDPPQIHAMREVLRGYADTGRTVLVSSHLLSEVEQTCQDVVVINHGTSIAAGRVVDLVASSGEMTFVVDDPDAAARLLREQSGIGDVHVDDSDRAESGTVVQVDLGDVPAAQAISMLVGAGVAVTSAAPRNRLEDVFLDMVGATGPAAGGTS
ncbi:alpha/beta fold hydrolase [Nakamurella sp. A5-74]|uniref:Alpha/beta fold hydrolase n=1 Tax=Nakamurella sp. A5-74 TaxID=3158264 RepID=A0AAU8DU65_9ACTN